MVGRIRHRPDGFDSVTNLVIVIPYEVDSLGGFHSVNPSNEFCGHPGERQPEHHLDWKAIRGPIEVAKRESIHSFAKTEGGEDHSHPNQAQRQAVIESKCRRGLVPARIERERHGRPQMQSEFDVKSCPFYAESLFVNNLWAGSFQAIQFVVSKAGSAPNNRPLGGLCTCL